MHVMVNMHVTLLLHECYMHVVRVLEMVAHVPCMLYELSNMHVGSACNMHVACMLYECWSNKHVGSACIMIFIYQ